MLVPRRVFLNPFISRRGGCCISEVAITFLFCPHLALLGTFLLFENWSGGVAIDFAEIGTRELGGDDGKWLTRNKARQWQHVTQTKNCG